MSIYDRSKWPKPEANPLVAMLRRGDRWYSNTEINAALDPSRRDKRSVIANWPTFADQLRDGDTIIESRHFLAMTSDRQGRTGGVERFYSKRGLILIAIRAQTINAAAFRDWLATTTAEAAKERELVL